MIEKDTLNKNAFTEQENALEKIKNIVYSSESNILKTYFNEYESFVRNKLDKLKKA